MGQYLEAGISGFEQHGVVIKKFLFIYMEQNKVFQRINVLFVFNNSFSKKMVSRKIDGVAMQLLRSLNTLDKIDRKQGGMSCFVDFRKAFDPIGHEIFLQKLANYGFKGPILKILDDCFNEPFQYVKTRIYG